MTQIYTSMKPIYSLFDLNTDLPDYLLNEYQYIIDINDEDIMWEQQLNDALLRLGNCLINKK